MNFLNQGGLSPEYYMSEALKEAKKAFEKKEVPVGAVIVHNSKIIAKAHNQIEMLHDATAHAEMIAITQAAEYLNNWRLNDAEIFVTIEPCIMCCGAIVLSRIKRLYYGARDPKMGGVESIADVISNPRLNHKVEVIAGIREEECAALIREFFEKIRPEKT